MDFKQIAWNLMEQLNIPYEGTEKDKENQTVIEAALSGCYIKGVNDGRAGDPQANRPY